MAPPVDQSGQTVQSRDVEDDSRRPALHVVRRATTALAAARRFAGRPTVRPWLVGITALAFLLLVVSSFRSLPDDSRNARPELVAVLVLVTTPATLLLNGLEYRFMARTLGHSVSIRHGLRVSLVASLANYLPAPGGIAVRTAALKSRGSTVRSAVSINAVAGLVWAGATGVIAGLAMLTTDRLAARATLAVAVGTVAMLVAVVMLSRGGAGWHRRLGTILAIETCLVVVAGVRVWVSLAAIGQATGFGASIAISGSSVLAAALGIFPAGLGLRELLAGGIATAVGVPAAAAVAATAVDRIASQVGGVLTAVATGVRLSDVRRADVPAEDRAVLDAATETTDRRESD